MSNQYHALYDLVVVDLGFYDLEGLLVAGSRPDAEQTTIIDVDTGEQIKLLPGDVINWRHK